MSSRALVLVGCGGFGREVYSLVHALNEHGESWDVVGFVDDGPAPADLSRIEQLGVPHLGGVESLQDCTPNLDVVVAIGSPAVRQRVVSQLAKYPVAFPSLVHPSATLGIQVTLGRGSIVAAGSRLSAYITVADFVHIDQQVAIGHDTRLDDFSRLNPSSCISGYVSIGVGALVGANATVLAGLEVGPWSVVGAGAVVTHGVAEGITVKGVPAR